jgi:uncharacterized protein involved in exopolysaccharide biosynthesis
MVEMSWGEGEISFSAILEVLLSAWRRIAICGVIGAVLFGAVAFLKPPMYAASASFVPQGSESAKSGLAGLAGQLGVTISPSNQALSPEFYRRLLQSRVLLEPIARDTIVVAEMANKKVPFFDLFKIPAGPPARRTQLAVARLESIVAVSIEKSTGVVQLSAGTRWPSVSLAIVTALVNGVNNYNERMRQSQAAAERRFVEGRLNVAGADLRAAEDRLAEFVRGNRQFGGASELNFERDRLQRDVSLKQQVFTTLTEAYEDARVREVRDTPVITMFEPPEVPALPQPRHRAQSIIFGLLLGSIAGILYTFASVLFRRREEQDEAASASLDASPLPARQFSHAR